MRKDIEEKIEIPFGINTKIEDNFLKIEKENNELKRKINPLIKIHLKDNLIILEAKKATRKEKKILGTFVAHINNMFKGLNERFKYKMQICAVHFPMTANFDKEKKQLVIKNFLGEKVDRKISIPFNVDIKINRDIIEIESFDKEAAGQAAGNIEKGTAVAKKDRRIFQDGIFIIEKPGRSFL